MALFSHSGLFSDYANSEEAVKDIYVAMMKAMLAGLKDRETEAGP